MHTTGGNYYDKYGTRSRIEKALMKRYLSSIVELLPPTLGAGAYGVLELGCGEGHLLNFISNIYRSKGLYYGRDIDEPIMKEARELYPHLFFGAQSVYDVSFDGPLGVVLLCEVLEHLEEPEKALARVATLPCDTFIFCVPREPIWRVLNLCRLRYLRRLGNTPGHIQHWTQSQFIDLVDRHFHIDRVMEPLPWTVVLGHPDHMRLA